MRLNNNFKVFITGFALVTILACNVLAPIPTATSLPVPATATVISTSTPVLLSQQVTLISSPFSEINQAPPYTITAQTPQLVGSNDPRVQAFNQRLDDLVKKEVEAFRQSFLENSAPQVSANGSSLNVTYTLISQLNEMWSLKLDFSFYADGAAHPGLNSITENYDLGQGRELALSELFLPNSTYLEALSAYCIADLKQQNPGIDDSFLGGADPAPENYRNWNITSQGLLITFDEYQVAPYAAGPQKVVVPYGEIRQLINEQGPLASLLD